VMSEEGKGVLVVRHNGSGKMLDPIKKVLEAMAQGYYLDFEKLYEVFEKNIAQPK